MTTANRNVPYLDTIMYLLGISREEVEAAEEFAEITTAFLARHVERART